MGLDLEGGRSRMSGTGGPPVVCGWGAKIGYAGHLRCVVKRTNRPPAMRSDCRTHRRGAMPRKTAALFPRCVARCEDFVADDRPGIILAMPDETEPACGDIGGQGIVRPRARRWRRAARGEKSRAALIPSDA